MNVLTSTHHGTLSSTGRMVSDHAATARIVISRHGRGGGRVPVRSLRHLTAGSQVSVRTRHVTQGGRIHSSRERTAGGVERGRGGSLIQVRIIHVNFVCTISLQRSGQIQVLLMREHPFATWDQQQHTHTHTDTCDGPTFHSGVGGHSNFGRRCRYPELKVPGRAWGWRVCERK